jgi:hypothetical protein
MASWVVSRIKHIWPFSRNKTDDLKVSDGLVRSLPVRESTKQFVFALRDPDYPSSVVYLLAAESLSERSASDAECLIRAIRPKVVVAQIGPSALDDVREEENNLNGDETCSVPTSWLGVLKGCFLERIILSKYESKAGSQILQTIFGTGFYGHVLAAKQAAQENHSPFLILETPHRNGQGGELNTSSEHDSNQDGPNKSTIAPLAEISQGSGLFRKTTPLPGDMVSSVPMSSHRHNLASSLDSSALKALTSSMAFSLQNYLALDSGSNCAPTASSTSSSAGCEFRDEDQIPAFAHSFYSLLVDLHDMFNNLPAIDRALVCARNMLLEVEKGKEVDCEVLSHVNKFRIAVEGLRVALNSKARCPLKQEKNLLKVANFYELPYEDKCHALFAQALKRQARDFGTVVAIVDASSLAGIRNYWNTSLPREVADLADNCFISDTSDDASEGDDPKRRNVLVEKPVVAVGAGAATVLGVTSFSKIVPVSTIVKMVTFKVPSIMKLGLLQTKRTAVVALGKVFTPAKLLAPASKGVIPGKIGFVSGVHVPATVKTAVAAEKLRAATHSVIAAAERSSLSAMRTAFYGIMQKRHGKATGGTPWIVFGGSILACTGLLAFGDGIECAVESAHAMPTIARLGRGLEKLRHASRVVHQMDSAQAWEAVYNSLYNLHNKK